MGRLLAYLAGLSDRLLCWNTALDRLFGPFTAMMEYIREDSAGTGAVRIHDEDGMAI